MPVVEGVEIDTEDVELVVGIFVDDDDLELEVVGAVLDFVEVFDELDVVDDIEELTLEDVEEDEETRELEVVVLVDEDELDFSDIELVVEEALDEVVDIFVDDACVEVDVFEVVVQGGRLTALL
jgi:hypothetical protein